jgi:ABC-type transport system substrate-binding protein
MTYWQNALNNRISRRRAMVATGASALGAAFLAACGGGTDGNSRGTKDASSLVVAAKDETKEMKRGGTLWSRTTSEPATMDPHVFPGNFASTHTHSGLWLIKDGYLTGATGEVEGDVIESWEMSPDKLTITGKVNPNVHFHPVAPVNGRAVDANDVVATFQRHKAQSNQRADFWTEVNPIAPIASITAPDARTVQIKLSEPNAVVLPLLGRMTPGSFFIIPKEGLDTSVLNLQRTSIGSGPWYISEFNSGVGYTYKRNPNFKRDKRGDIPYIDEVKWPVVNEYATFLAQFKAGSIHLANGIRAEDILPVKSDHPEVEIMQAPFTTRIQRIGFGVAEGSPFRDERLRQAWSMTIDRGLYLDTVYNLSKFKDGGLPVESVWEAGLQADNYQGWVLDAKAKDFGPNAKYFEYNVAEAKKLVAAAGYTGEPEMILPARQSVRNVAYYDGLEAIYGMTQESGVFKFKITYIANYDADWVINYHNQAKQPFNGVTISLSSLAQDPATYLYAYYNSKGQLRQGTDSTLDDLTKRAQAEFDTNRRRQLVHDIQRYEGGKMFFPRIGGARGFSVSWPAVRNREVYQGGTQRALTTLWLDQTKAPFKKS